MDEIKWTDWLNRMNPTQASLYNQIADDRDHAGMRLPNKDLVDYGYGPQDAPFTFAVANCKYVESRFKCNDRSGKHCRQSLPPASL